VNARRLLAIPAVLTLALLASGGRATSRRNTYPANPCIVDDARFQSLHGGCYDSQTHLVWSMNAGNPQRLGGIWDYPSATAYASGLNEGGETGWRLPTLAELRGVAGPAAQQHLNVFYNSNVQNPDGTYGGYGDYPLYSTTAGKKGACKPVVAKQLIAGTEGDWGTKPYGQACGSATDFVCVRVHQASDPN
jgi:hypothetical protein